MYVKDVINAYGWKSFFCLIVTNVCVQLGSLGLEAPVYRTVMSPFPNQLNNGPFLKIKLIFLSVILWVFHQIILQDVLCLGRAEDCKTV